MTRNLNVENKILFTHQKQALEKAKKELGISSGIIMCFLRHLDEESAFKILEVALKHKKKKTSRTIYIYYKYKTNLNPIFMLIILLIRFVHYLITWI